VASKNFANGSAQPSWGFGPLYFAAVESPAMNNVGTAGAAFASTAAPHTPNNMDRHAPAARPRIPDFDIRLLP
jgi:hypothetical protein